MKDTTQDTLDLLKGAYGNPLSKATSTITQATGLVSFDLQAPAKALYPIITLISKRIPRVAGNGGTATNWRQINSILGSGFDAMGWVPEGQRAGAMTLNTSNKAAAYVTLGEEGQISFEATSAAQGFEDARSRASRIVLQKAMRKEELAIIGGNASLALGTPATPTASAAGSGATLPAATYGIQVVALTFEGWKNSSVAGGVATSTTVTGQDGNTFALNGGSSNKSAAASQAVTLGQTLSASVAPVQGAVAYAWYVGTGGTNTLQAITTVNAASFSAPLNASSQNVSAITADSSRNSGLAFDGLLTAALNPVNGAYVNNLNGAYFTSSSRGSVNEIDAMLKSMWDQFRLSPTVIFVSSQEQMNITNKVLNASSATLLRQNVQLGEPGAVVAGSVVSHYYNPFSLGGGVMIPILLHPDIPPGTILAWADNLPAQYQSNEVPNVAEMKLRRDWYDVEWPLVTRAYQHGIYEEGVLAIYAPFALGVITNIGNG